MKILIAALIIGICLSSCAKQDVRTLYPKTEEELKQLLPIGTAKEYIKNKFGEPPISFVREGKLIDTYLFPSPPLNFHGGFLAGFQVIYSEEKAIAILPTHGSAN
jgi:hypothetical protein